MGPLAGASASIEARPSSIVIRPSTPPTRLRYVPQRFSASGQSN